MRSIVFLFISCLYLLPAQSATILVLGDSLSAGYRMSSEQGWVNLLYERLTDLDDSHQVINSSISGATTAAGLQQIDKLLNEFDPDIMVLELGGNDGLQGKPVSYISSNLEQMIQSAIAHDTLVVLAGVRIPPNYGLRYTEPFFNQYGDLADQYNLLYIPFILEGIAENQSLMQPDGIHPTAEAQPMVLENVWPAIKSALEQLP